MITSGTKVTIGLAISIGSFIVPYLVTNAVISSKVEAVEKRQDNIEGYLKEIAKNVSEMNGAFKERERQERLQALEALRKR